MTLAIRPVTLRRLATLLALMMLVLSTVADAATCGTETAFSGDVEIVTLVHQAEAEVGDEPSDTEVPVEQHGVCAHGHCHHGSSIENPVASVESPNPLIAHVAVRFARLSSVDREIVSPPPRS